MKTGLNKNNMVYVLDTNIIIQYLKQTSIVMKNFQQAVSLGYRLLLPRAVDYEICRGLALSSATKKISIYHDLTAPSPKGQCEIVDMGEHIWNHAKQIYTSLRRKGFTVGEIDILIGAFCLHYNYTLVTANIKDFKHMDGLEIKDWQLSP